MTAREADASALAALLSRERALVLAGIAGTVALSWAYVVAASADMYGAMSGLSAWMMTAAWDAPYFARMLGMWSVMMVGMMLPSAVPAILLYARVLRRSPGAAAPVARTYAFTLGYLLAWGGFSVAATALQWALAEAALLSPMLEASSARLGAGVLVLAGLYQLTPLKRDCLTRCRSPAEFITRHWRPGLGGALRLGAHHGLYCVGCCGALMLLLFAGGVMSLAWIAAITLFVLVEKLAPLGAQGGRLSGVLLAGTGALLLALA